MTARGAAAFAAAVVASLAGLVAAAAPAVAGHEALRTSLSTGHNPERGTFSAGTGGAPAPPLADSVAVEGPAAAPYVRGEVLVRGETGGERVVPLPPGVSVPVAAKALNARPGVARATPNYVATGAAYVPDDPGRSGVAGGWRNDQWSFLGGAGGLDAADAWSGSVAPGSGVTVAVLDSGVAYRRQGSAYRADPDLAGTEFVHPRDFVDGDRLPLDENGHGTHVAATIAESTDNGVGLTGLAYGARVMPIRVLDANLNGSASQIARGIRFAARHGARVINLSLAFGSAVTKCAQIAIVCRSIKSAARHGSLVVAAGGNDAAPSPALPAAAPHVLAVGAATATGCLASYSSRAADLVAPGGGADAAVPGDSACNPGGSAPGITQLSLDPSAAAGGNYGLFSYVELQGTSQAAAEASGAAALVIGSGVPLPRTGPLGVALRLACTATDTGHPRYFGRRGRSNVARAVDPNVGC